MKQRLYVIVLLSSLIGCAYGSPGVTIDFFYPAKDFRSGTIRKGFERVPPHRFSEEYTPIHAAIFCVYEKIQNIDMRGAQRPEIERIEINDGIVIIYSKHDRGAGWGELETLRLCLKLSISEAMTYGSALGTRGQRYKRSLKLHMPGIKGFILQYKNGDKWPVEGYYAVIEPVKEYTQKEE